MDGPLLARLIARHGADRLAVGIDARDGRVAPRGSPTVLDVSPLELAKRLLAAGVRTIVFTDAARDGALAGADVAGARAIAALGFDVIVSGGVASLDDLRRARDARLAGAIVGRALHEGRFTLREALACLAG
jgi:phosphoribosylformimino-5-aminoimidazole carboxamide ribotide isomerase